MRGGTSLGSRLAQVLTLAAVLLLAFSARGQEKKRDELGVSITFGWQGQMPTERWAPITAAISSGDSTIAGSLIAEYEQDATNLARYSAPFATTPGAGTQVQVFVALPAQCAHVKLSVVSEAGKTLWMQTYTMGGTPPNLQLPAMIGPEMPIVAVAGRSFVPQAFKDWPGIAANPSYEVSSPVRRARREAASSDRAWTYATGVRADFETLPTAWMGYDSLAALVVIPDAERRPDPRAVDAVHRWVESGGRLVVQVDGPGELWREWVPKEWGVELGAVVRGAIPGNVADAVRTVASRVAVIREKEAGGAPTAGTGGDIPSPAASVTMRPIRIAAHTGAETRWPVGEAGGVLVVTAGEGYGSVTLVGFDPVKATETASAVAAGAVWREVLDPVVADALERAAAPYEDRYQYGYGYMMTTSQSIMNSGLERLARVPGLGESVMVAILGCILALAGLVGPVDYFLLRRLRALQRSWVTALVWVGIASAGAVVVPRLIRAEPTRVNRVSVEDCVAMPISGSRVGAPRAFRSGLTGIYAGDSGVAHFAKPDTASWWRGVSAQSESQIGAAKGSALVPVVQRAAGGESGSERAGPLTDLPLALWTFRTFTDESVPAPSIRARVREKGDGWSVLVAGLPGRSRVINAALRAGGKWATLEREARVKDEPSEAALPDAPAPTRSDDLKRQGLGSMDDGVWTAVFPSRFAETRVPRAWSLKDYIVNRYSMGAAADMRPGVLLGMNGPARRGQGIERAVAAGWVAVYLEVGDWPPDTGLTWPFKGEQTRVLRVLVPMDGD